MLELEIKRDYGSILLIFVVVEFNKEEQYGNKLLQGQGLLVGGNA